MSKLVPIHRAKEKPPRRRKKITPFGRVVVAISIVVLLLAAVKAARVVTLLLAGSVPVVEGAVETSWSGEALVVRAEEAYASEKTGWLHPVVAEGAKVRTGALVCNIIDDEGRVLTALTAAHSGVVSYRVDGMEDMAPGAQQEAVWAAYRNLRGRLRRDGDKITAGDRIYKLIDNYSFAIYASVKGPQELVVGQDARVRLPSGEMIMQIRQAEQVGDRFLVQLNSTEYPAAVTEWRHLADLELARGRRFGLVVPTSSIVESASERTGVYLLIAGRPHYKRVEVVASSQNEAVVTGIPVEAQVILRPNLLWLTLHSW